MVPFNFVDILLLLGLLPCWRAGRPAERGVGTASLGVSSYGVSSLGVMATTQRYVFFSTLFALCPVFRHSAGFVNLRPSRMVCGRPWGRRRTGLAPSSSYLRAAAELALHYHSFDDMHDQLALRSVFTAENW